MGFLLTFYHQILSGTGFDLFLTESSYELGVAKVWRLSEVYISNYLETLKHIITMLGDIIELLAECFC